MGDTNFAQYPDYVELLIMIGDKTCRQQGLASEAVRLMVAHISKFLNDRVIQASVCPDNIACIKLLEKLGFEPSEGSSEDRIFVLPNERRLEIEKTVNESKVYTNEHYVESLLNKSRLYYKSMQ